MVRQAPRPPIPPAAAANSVVGPLFLRLAALAAGGKCDLLPVQNRRCKGDSIWCKHTRKCSSEHACRKYSCLTIQFSVVNCIVGCRGPVLGESAAQYIFALRSLTAMIDHTPKCPPRLHYCPWYAFQARVCTRMSICVSGSTLPERMFYHTLDDAVPA